MKTHNCNLSESRCIDIPGAFKCVCNAGYIQINDYQCKERRSCETEGHQVCNSTVGQCVDQPGGNFQCRCDFGYTLTKDNQCEDVDECWYHHLCNLGMRFECRNTDGSYDCVCVDSDLDYKDFQYQVPCEDINECQVYKANDCDLTTTRCENLDGSYRCNCLILYERINHTSCRGTPFYDNAHWLSEASHLKSACRGLLSAALAQQSDACQAHQRFVGCVEDYFILRRRADLPFSYFVQRLLKLAFPSLKAQLQEDCKPRYYEDFLHKIVNSETLLF
ncbi:latent-transforming growth factor beta-binding protein 1 [Elysia marginata]|uniref:Latent-transforming growth factor beta-binding protein 1 n=1 Tax=Elysia marginata TaxID=1093978 RepID=A0AAV4J9B1_9GAST|nr:latent-transforming growth factor beta-binding protein 1 [Elysia marginata]